MPIDSELNSALENQTYFYKEFGRGAGRSSRTEKNLQKRSLAPIAAKLESARTKLFLTGRCLGTVLLKQSSSRSWPVSCQKSQNRAKSNQIFPGKARGDRASILRYLDSPIAKVFCQLLNIFFDFDHLQ